MTPVKALGGSSVDQRFQCERYCNYGYLYYVFKFILGAFSIKNNVIIIIIMLSVIKFKAIPYCYKPDLDLFLSEFR